MCGMDVVEHRTVGHGHMCICHDMSPIAVELLWRAVYALQRVHTVCRAAARLFCGFVGMSTLWSDSRFPRVPVDERLHMCVCVCVEREWREIVERLELCCVVVRCESKLLLVASGSVRACGSTTCDVRCESVKGLMLAELLDDVNFG